MSWDSATAPRHITRALLVELQLPAESVWIHDGVGPLSWQPPTSDSPQTWQGVGDLGAVSGISGGVDLAASDVTLSLSGVPSEYRDSVLSELARGSRVNIYQGVIDPAAGVWTFEPELVFAGFIDDPEIEESTAEDLGSFLTITVPVIAASSYARRISIWRRTDADQQSLFPGDKFFAFKTDLRVPVPTTGLTSILGDHVFRPLRNAN